MEDTKEIKEAASQSYWWESPSIKYEDLQGRSDHWTLGADAATATLLQQISSKMIARTHEVEAALKVACEDVDDLNVALANVTTSFHFLSNTQFTENRAYQEDERARDVIDKAPAEVMEATQENLLSSCREAIAEGLKLVNSSYLKVEISDSESEEGQQEGLTVYKLINPYEKRRLPHIIGSSSFYSDDTVGLFEHPVEEQENDVETSSVGSAELKDDSSRPIVGTSSMIEVDDESDSDESFVPSSRSVVTKDDASSCQPEEKSRLLGNVATEISDNFLKPTNTLPLFNGMSSDSDDGGPLFGPPSNVPDSKNSFKNILSREPPPLYKEVDEKASSTGNRTIPTKRADVVAGGGGSSTTRGREVSKSVLFGSESDDDDSLFSTRRIDKSGAEYQKKAENSGQASVEKAREGQVKVSEDQVKGSSASFRDNEEGNEKLNENFDQNRNEDFSAVARKKPVGGINIFNSAITRAIESQHSSLPESSPSSGKSQLSPGSDQLISSRNSSTRSALGESGTKIEHGKSSLFSDDDKEEGRAPALPSKGGSSSQNTKDLKAPLISPSDGALKASLFSDEESLFNASKPFTGTQLPPPLQETKSAAGGKGESGKGHSLFSDSDDDLFKPIRQTANSWKSGQTDSHKPGAFFEPPPIPQSPNPPPPLQKGRKANTAKKAKTLTSIFDSSSSDDDIFASRKPVPKPEQNLKPSLYPGKQPVRTSHVSGEANSVGKSGNIPNDATKKSDGVESSVAPNDILTKSIVTKTAEGSGVNNSGRALERPLSVASAGNPRASDKVKSLFGTSDEDDDDLFAPKPKGRETGGKDPPFKGLLSNPETLDSSEDLFKNSRPGVSSGPAAKAGNFMSTKGLTSTSNSRDSNNKKTLKGEDPAVVPEAENRLSSNNNLFKSDILDSSDDDLFKDTKISVAKGTPDVSSETPSVPSRIEIHKATIVQAPLDGLTSTTNDIRYSSDEDLFKSVKRGTGPPKVSPKPVSVDGSSKIISVNAPKVASVTNPENKINSSTTPVSDVLVNVSILPSNLPSTDYLSRTTNAVAMKKENDAIISSSVPSKVVASLIVSKGAAPKKISFQKSTSESSDDDLFKTVPTRSAQNMLPSKLSNSSLVPSSKTVSPKNKREYTNKVPDTSTNKIPNSSTNKIPDSSSNKIPDSFTTNTERKPKNIFSSDSDEDIFKSSSKVGSAHKQTTKSIFSDSDEIDDIFSSDFIKSRKSIVKSLDKSNIQSSGKSVDQSSEKSTLQSSNNPTVPSSNKSNLHSSKKSNLPSSEKSNLPSSDKSNLPSSDKSNLQSSEKSNLPSSDKSNFQSSEKSNLPSSEKSNLPSSDQTISNFEEVLKAPQNVSSTPSPSTPAVATSSNGQKEHEPKGLRNPAQKSKVLKPVETQTSEVSKVGNSSVKFLFEDDDDDEDIFGSRAVSAPPFSRTPSDKKSTESKDDTDGACVSRDKDPQSLSEDKTTLAQPQPVSPTKKPPFGGVSLFGGKVPILPRVKDPPAGCENKTAGTQPPPISPTKHPVGGVPLFEGKKPPQLVSPTKKPPVGGVLLFGGMEPPQLLSPTKKPPVGGVPLFGGMEPPQLLSPTKKPPVGGVPLFGGKEPPELLSPTKKPPVGGVPLFGGNELLSKLKLRRKSSSSDHEEELTPEEGKTPPPNAGMLNTPLPVPDVDKFQGFSKPSGVAGSQPSFRLPVPSHLTTGTPRVPGSPSEEMGVSFDEAKRASDVLVSLNKNRPKIQRHRQPPSRSKRGHSSSTESDYVDGSPVKSEDDEVIDDVPGEMANKKMKSSTVDKRISSTSKVDEKTHNQIATIDSITNSVGHPKAASTSDDGTSRKLNEDSFKAASAINDVSNVDDPFKNKNVGVSSSTNKPASNVDETSRGVSSNKYSDNVKSTLKPVSVDDIFGEDSSGKTSTKKTVSSTNIFDDDDDENIDDLFNAPQKVSSKPVAVSSTTKTDLKMERKEFTSKVLPKKTSLFSDDDDSDGRLFSSTKPTKKSSTAKVSTGKQAAKRSSLFADDDSSDSDLFSSGPSKAIKNKKVENPSKTGDKNKPPNSTPTQIKRDNAPPEKEKKFVDPLMGKIS